MPESKGKRVILVGVALDDSISNGISYLHGIDGLDEVSVGNNWLNSTAIHYVWQSPGGLASIPQLIALDRHVTVTRDRITFGPEHVILRLRGIPEMLGFLHAQSAAK